MLKVKVINVIWLSVLLRRVGGVLFFLIFLPVFLVLTAPRVLALDPHKKITQYVHDSWGLEAGLPQITVQTIVQTRDEGWHFYLVYYRKRPVQ